MRWCLFFLVTIQFVIVVGLVCKFSIGRSKNELNAFKIKWGRPSFHTSLHFNSGLINMKVKSQAQTKITFRNVV